MLFEEADEVMMALEMAVPAPRLMVLVQEGEARDNLFPPPPASFRRLRFFSFLGISFILVLA